MPELTTKMYEFRKALNIQQAELAEMVGVRRETIGKLENGKYNPSLKLAMDIAKVFAENEVVGTRAARMQSDTWKRE